MVLRRQMQRTAARRVVQRRQRDRLMRAAMYTWLRRTRGERNARALARRHALLHVIR